MVIMIKSEYLKENKANKLVQRVEKFNIEKNISPIRAYVMPMEKYV